MNENSENGISINDAYAYHSMAFEIVEEILKHVDNPIEIRNRITAFFRELTGARIIILHEVNINNLIEMTFVNPSRKTEIANSCEVSKLAEYIYANNRSFVWNCHDSDETADPLLAILEAGISMGFPLSLGENYIGSILMFNLPTHERIELARSTITLISSIIALAFKNSRQFENQERIIGERTKDIKENQKKLNTLINNLPGLVYRSPIDDFFARDYISENCDEYFGFEKGYLTRPNKCTIKEIINSNDFTVIEKIIKDAVEGQKPIELIYRITTKDGTEKWIWDKASIVCSDEQIPAAFDGFLTDITEKKKAEEAQIQSEERFKQVAECSGTWVWEVDALGLYTYVSPMVETLLGYKPEEIVNKKYFYDFFVQERKDELKNAALGAFLKKESFVNFENRNLRKDGLVVVFETTGIPLLDSEGNLLGYRGADRDVTDRKKSEEELEKHRNHLEELVESRTEEIDAINKDLIREIELKNEAEQKLEVALEKEKELNEMKSRFISTTSHEFRTPLTALSLSVDLIKKYGDKWSDEKKHLHFDRIKDSIHYLTGLLDDILTISRAESGEINYNPEFLNLEKLAQESVRDARLTLKVNHELKFYYNTEVTEYYLDSKLIKSIFNNLLSNAIKYSPDKGRIEMVITAKQDKLLIKVSDEGIGIPADEIDKIFNSFYRTRNAADIPGTGLGLTIVKRAVDFHGGMITVTSKLNEGTTFTVEIPQGNSL